jgi:hypothetical protein
MVKNKGSPLKIETKFVTVKELLNIIEERRIEPLTIYQIYSQADK